MYYFIGGGNGSTWRKTPTCRKLYCIMLYRVHLAMSRIRLTTVVVIVTYYTGIQLPLDHDHNGLAKYRCGPPVNISKKKSNM